MNIIKKVRNLLKDESGYGTVELVILVAAIGILATSLMEGLKTTLVGEDGAVDKVGTQLGDIIGDWSGSED